jgi:hypothetical protein
MPKRPQADNGIQVIKFNLDSGVRAKRGSGMTKKIPSCQLSETTGWSIHTPNAIQGISAFAGMTTRLL